MKNKIKLFILKRKQIRLSKKVSTTKDKVGLLNKARELQHQVAELKEQM